MPVAEEAKKLVSSNSSAKSEETEKEALLEVRDGGGGGVIFLFLGIKIELKTVHKRNGKQRKYEKKREG